MRDQVAELHRTLERVAEANAHAAELMVELQLTRSELEERNKALERAKEAAEASDRCKSVFLAAMSHELRTPLNAIIGYSEMLEEELRPLERADVTRDLNRIRSAGTYLLGLISDILDLSKIDAGKMKLDLEPVAAGFAVRDVCELAGPLMSRHQNRLILGAIDDELQVMADPARLRQCLENLLSNAAKFTSGGEVHVAVRREGDDARFEVRDTGIGIAPEVLPRLFEPFVQANGTVVRTRNGTGLGLAICRRLARLMGGDVTVESRPGAGAKFTLRMPAACA